jgi:hypothetical protein
MAEALKKSLVPRSTHFFHVFISYRVASEKELARALYEKLSALQVGAKMVRLKVYLVRLLLRLL